MKMMRAVSLISEFKMSFPVKMLRKDVCKEPFKKLIPLNLPLNLFLLHTGIVNSLFVKKMNFCN